MNPQLARSLWSSEIAKNIRDPHVQLDYLAAIAMVADFIFDVGNSPKKQN